MLKEMFSFVLIAVVFCGSAKVRATEDWLGGEDKTYEDRLFEIDYPNDISKLNKLLVKRESSEDVNTNLKLVEQLYEEFQHEQPKIGKRLSTTKLGATKLFLDLGTVLKPETKCTRDAQNILLQNQKITRHNGYRKLEQGQCLRRVESILQQVAIEHSKQCLSTYLSNYKAKMSAFNDRESLEKVRKIFGNVSPSSDGKAAFDFITHLNSEKAYIPNDKFFYNKLKENISNQDEAKFLNPVEDETKGAIEANGDQLRAILNKNLIGACDSYVHETEDVFEPLDLDASWYHEVQDNEMELYKDWTRFILCKKVKAKEREIAESLTKYVNQL